MKIGNKTIGEKTYVIAEFGVNHNGSIERAKEGIRKAAEAGADAIKFQTYTADELVVKGTPKFWEWEGDKQHETQYDAYKALKGLPYEAYPELIKYCEELGIEFLSTPFSFEAAKKLNDMGMKAFKIASSDMSTLPFLEYVARFGKPIILSTGASELGEIKEAVRTIERAGNDQIVILHCNLCYPTKDSDANLNVIQTLKKEFPWHPIGISDHTLGVFPTVVASAVGAVVIEKHYTVDKTLGESADHWLSVDPVELKDIVDTVRKIEELKGHNFRSVFPSEKETRKYDKRSIVSAFDIKKGDEVTMEMLTYKRPGTGIAPRDYLKLLGRKALQDIKEDTTLQWNLFQKK